MPIKNLSEIKRLAASDYLPDASFMCEVCNKKIDVINKMQCLSIEHKFKMDFFVCDNCLGVIKNKLKYVSDKDMLRLHWFSKKIHRQSVK